MADRLEKNNSEDKSSVKYRDLSKTKYKGNPDFKLFQYKGFKFISTVHEKEYLDSLENFEIRDTDILAVTYPKSGTVWIQYILALMYYGNEVNGPDGKLTVDVAPWIEAEMESLNYNERPSPRVFVSHLPHYLVPKGLRKGRGKVIYLARNPKDVAVSFYHFHNYSKTLENQNSFDEFFYKFLTGEVFCSSWFDHVKGWFNSSNDFDILFLTYEDMVKDLRTEIMKISKFLERNCDDRKIDEMVEKCTFQNMKNDKNANYQLLHDSFLDHAKGKFLRKGKVGDWKNYFTVKQNETFEKVYQEQMKDCPVELIWDISE
ncbi:amine sulfotransferase-like isoform X1 [Polypterus senegalus]|uniref:amine sulfotransferase-like isoform X1 n=1 Tax=Polypterus senegalus TaxID=55291 RepID=UPI0019654791|nr:amine sulfotransferase-like isoform X1 [Polypterus senegalus]